MYFVKAVLVFLSFLIFLKVFRFLQDLYHKVKCLKTIPKVETNLLKDLLSFNFTTPNEHFRYLTYFAEKFYPIYRFSFLHLHTVNLMHPDDIELVLTSNKHLTKGSFYNYLHNWLGAGLLTSTGSHWHKRRKILTPAFHFQILLGFLKIFNDETNKLVESLKKNEGIIDVVQFVKNFTLQSIAETAMGFDSLDEITQLKYKESIFEIGRVLFARFCNPWYRIASIYQYSSLYKEEQEKVKYLHQISHRIIRERETQFEEFASRKKKVMLDLLLFAKKQGAHIDYEGIREEVDTFMFEGHDTTSMAISYLLLVLANHQEIQSQILDEILAVVGPTELPTYENLQNLKYTERCIKETLRLYPSVAHISRVSGEEFVTKTGHRIPKGVAINIPIFNIHRNETLFPDPEKFDPDRFLPEATLGRHPFSYLPFSAGSRNCIGQKFAVLEIKAVLCGILRNFKLEEVLNIKDLEFTLALVLQPVRETPIRVKLLKRLL